MDKERKYLKWYNKVGYGSGDLAANCVYGLLNNFVLLYLTDIVGLNPAIIGILMMIAKIFDGFTDIIVGNLIDKTHTKFGKARPWMLFSAIGNFLCLILCFAIPSDLGKMGQYVYFFIAYSVLNAIFYTANNISYSSLTALITKNKNERVQLGSIRFIFSMATNLVIGAITVNLSTRFGGGTEGWRMVAIIYASISLIVNTISVFSVKEVMEDEESEKKYKRDQSELSLIKLLIIVLKNKYYVRLVLIYLFTYLQSGFMGIAVYYMRDVVGDTSKLGLFSFAARGPVIIGCLFTPLLVKRFKGMYKVNLSAYMLCALFRGLFVVAGLMRNVPLMFLTYCIATLGASPLTADLNALIAETSENIYLNKGVHLEGMIYSSASIGIKVGSGLGIAISGILLEVGGYISGAAVQPQSYIHMLEFMYLWVPFIVAICIVIILTGMTVEKENIVITEAGKESGI